MGKINYYQWINGGCGCNGVRHISGTNDCDCDQILLEISNLHTDDEVLQDEIDDLSGDVATKLDASAYTPVDLTAYATKEWVEDKHYITTVQPLKTINGESIVGEGNITISGGSGTTVDAYTKAESDARFQPIGNYATEQWVLDKHYITGVDLSDYALKSEIPTVPSNVSSFINDAGYVTDSILIQYITNLQQQINSLIASISGCCSSSGETQYRWITETGENDYWCDGTTKKTMEKEQSSTDGLTWTDTGSERSGSTVLEENCIDCGYVPEHYKLLLTKTDNAPYVVYCNGDSEAKTSETHNGISASSIKEAVIGDCVDTLGNKLFSYCTSLSSVTINSGVTTFNTGAFYGCTSLSSVTIPSSVTFIGQETFSGCTSLKNVNIPNGIEDVKAMTFAYTNIESISIPNSVNRILNHSFDHCTNLKNVNIGTGCTQISMAFTNCTGLQTITVNATTPPMLLNSPFENTNNTFVIKVPSGSVNTYKSASGWSAFASRIQAI